MFVSGRGFQIVVLVLLISVGWFIGSDPLALAQQPGGKLTAEQQQQINQIEKLNAQVQKLYGEGKSREAIGLAKQSLALCQKVLGEEHTETATSLNNLGFLLNTLGDYAAARPYYEQSLKIKRKVLGDEHPGTANSLNNLGFLLQSQGDYPAARSYYEQALKIRKKVLGDEHPDTTTSLNNLGAVLQAQGDLVAARPYYELALKINKKILGDEHPDTARSLNNLGFLFQAKADYAAARTYYEQALKIRKKVLGGEHPDTARSLNNLGDLLREQGDYTAAYPYYEQALKINKKILGEEHPDTATSLSNLGALLQSQGDYAVARSYYELALKIRKKVLGNEHPDTAMSLNNLGFLLDFQGDYAAAYAYYDQALKINKKVLGDEHPDTATSLNNLGLLLRVQGNNPAARRYFDQALKIKRKALGDEHPSTATTLNNLGDLFQFEGDYAAARPYFEQALKIREKVLGGEHPDTARSLNNLGSLLREQGDFAAARPFLERSLMINKKVLGDEHPDTATLLNNLVILEMAGGNAIAAVKLIEQSRRGTRRHIARVLPALSEREQRLFLERNDEPGFYVALSVARANQSNPELTALSAGWLLNGKGVGQAALAERTLLTRDLTDPTQKDLVQQMLNTRQQLAALTMSAPKVGQESVRREALDKLTSEEDRLARQLTETSGRAVETDPWAELPRVRKALPKEAMLIDIARFKVFNFQVKGKEEKYQPARYVAWMIPPAGNGTVQIVDLGPADVIDAIVETARKTIQAANDANGVLRQQGEAEADKHAMEILQKLANLIWKPLAEKLNGAQQVILSPDGALWLVPWGALPVAEGKLLLEAYPLRYVVSGRDVVNANLKKLTKSEPTIFADPDFDLSAAETRQSIQAVFPNRNLDALSQTRGATSQTTLPRVARLPNTATEAQAIAPNIERFTKGKPQAYTDRYALEGVFKSVQRPSLLVLSTHGFFLPDQEVKQDDQRLASTETHAALLTVEGKPVENPLLRCGLLLAGCNSHQSAAGDDGILTGMEIVGVDLRGTELVVLSACETGIGKIRNGEGVAGLRQAFQLAGAKSVVATLWQVPDRDSMLIMNDFFQNMADGQSRVNALCNAQLARMQARRDKNGAAHPFFWAAWTLTGE